MVSLNKLIAGACALISFVQAAPVVVTVTDVVTVTTWTTISGVTTVYAPLSESPAATNATVSSVEQTAPVAAYPSSQPAVNEINAVAPPSTTTYLPTTTPVIPVRQVTTPITSQTSPVVQQPPTTLQTTTGPAIPTTTPAAPQTSAASASTTGGQCEGSGNTCTGDVTHWDGGLGACGWVVNSASDMQIALPVGMMGAVSNGNPYCGRSVTLKDPASGIEVKATVGDKCMGCAGQAIDCTDAVFNAITGGTGDGRVHGIQWYFN